MSFLIYSLRELDITKTPWPSRPEPRERGRMGESSSKQGKDIVKENIKISLSLFCIQGTEGNGVSLGFYAKLGFGQPILKNYFIGKSVF